MAQQIKPLVAKPDNLNLILGTTLRRKNKPAHTGCHCDLTYMQSFIHTEKKKISVKDNTRAGEMFMCFLHKLEFRYT